MFEPAGSLTMGELVPMTIPGASSKTCSGTLSHKLTADGRGSAPKQLTVSRDMEPAFAGSAPEQLTVSTGATQSAAYRRME